MKMYAVRLEDGSFDNVSDKTIPYLYKTKKEAQAVAELMAAVKAKVVSVEVEVEQ